MSRKYTFRVPASTANLGAGFDALSMGFDRYLRVTLEESTENIIEARGLSAASIPTTSENLIVRVAQSVARKRNRPLPPFRMLIDNEIPLARGLGSSAAAIIAGVTCYELMATNWRGDRLSDREIFEYSYEFEDHPDNLSGALYGGLNAAATSADGEVFVSRVRVAEGIQPVVVIPVFELSTGKARAVLPQTYSRQDAVYNLQRTALTIAALTTGEWRNLREGMRDRIHQPYRAALIPGLSEILALDIPGLAGVALSGAGPTVLALALAKDAAAIGDIITATFARHAVEATPHVMKIDTVGRFIETS